MDVLPKDNVSGRISIDKTLFDSVDWVAGKTAADIEAAQRVIARLWAEKKTEAVKQLIDEAISTVIVSQPSTSRCNVIPFTFAQTLAKEIGAESFPGEFFYTVLHSKEIKHVPRFQRVFHPREYIVIDQAKITEKLAGKTVLIAEDLLTTGGSVKHFIRALNRSGIHVTGVAALTGDPRLFVDDKTRLALQGAMHQKHIDLPLDMLAESLTRTEARGLILLINNLRTENAREKLTRKLQGILDQGIVANLGGDTEQAWHQGTQGQDTGYGPVPQGIPPWDILEIRQRSYLTRQQIGNSPSKALPDDLASLQATWQAELEKRLAPIKAKAARVEKKLTTMLVRHDEHIGYHEKAKPKAPAGLLATLHQRKYHEDLASWGEIQQRLALRQRQLRQRLQWVREYVRDPVSSLYQSKAQQLAVNKLSTEQPDLLRRLKEAQGCHLRQRAQQVNIDLERQKRSRDQNRGRHH